MLSSKYWSYGFKERNIFEVSNIYFFLKYKLISINLHMETMFSYWEKKRYIICKNN